MKADRVRIQLLGLNSKQDRVLSLAEVRILGEASRNNKEIIEAWLVGDTGPYSGETDASVMGFDAPFHGSGVPNAIAALLGMTKNNLSTDKIDLVFNSHEQLEYAHLEINLNPAVEPDVDYQVYCSTDLENWELCEAAPVLVSESAEMKKVRHRANDPTSTADKIFMRISIDPEGTK